MVIVECRMIQIQIHRWSKDRRTYEQRLETVKVPLLGGRKENASAVLLGGVLVSLGRNTEVGFCGGM